MNLISKVAEIYFPQGAFPIVSDLLEPHNLEIKIVKSRTTKFADFNPSDKKNKLPLITINNNLNPYSFLLTLLHEFAHYLVWKDGHLYAKPHGRTWKNHYSELVQKTLKEEIFPENLSHLITKHIQNPRATSCTDINLYRKLSTFDTESAGVFIDDIPDGAYFQTRDKQIYCKEKKVRKLILCTNHKKRKKYLFSPIYKVFPMKNQQFVIVFP